MRYKPCGCSLRAIFRICYKRFRHCVTKEKNMSRVTLEYTPTNNRRISWGRKDEEYAADFTLVSKRTLTDSEYRVFKYHYLLGADWRLCCRRLNMDRGAFFHEAYRIERKLGQAFRELQPYGLYPLDEYFSPTSQVPFATPGQRRCERRASLRPLLAPLGYSRPLLQAA